MAINFPSSPTNGQTYDYGNVRYTFTNTGGAPGYWKIIEPGLGGPASVADINAGTESGKWIAPDALTGSNFMKDFDLSANGGAASKVTKNAGLNVTSGGEGGVTIARSGNDIVVNTRQASNVAKGVARLSTSVFEYSGDMAAGSADLNHTFKLALGATFGGTRYLSNYGYTVQAANWTEANGGDFVMTLWGVYDMAGAATNTFHVGFGSINFVPIYSVQLQGFEGGPQLNSQKVISMGANGFDFQNHWGTTYAKVMWTAIGKVYIAPPS